MGFFVVPPVPPFTPFDPAENATNMLTAGDLVTKRIDLLNGYAQNAYEVTTAYINNIAQLITSLTLPETDPITAVYPEVPPFSIKARPTLSSITLPNTWPTNKATKPNFTSSTAITNHSWPVLDTSIPTYIQPEAPVLSNITAPGDVPSTNAITIPTAPSITLPSPPVFTDVIIPSAPSISIPEFLEVPPDFNIDSPGVFSWGEPVYNSDIWSDLLSKVLYSIRNGGTGLDVVVESDLFQRHIDRTFAENEKLYDNTTEFFASRGWTKPPGTLMSAISEINQQISRNNVTASRDITIAQAELAQKNTQFMIEMGAKLEGLTRDFYTSNTNRTLEASKVLAENAVAMYNARVQQVSLAMEAFKVNLSAYETRVKSVLISVEVYKAQVEGAKISVEAQKSLVDIYNAQVGSAEIILKLYASEMEGAKIASEIEISKLEQYKVLTQAYVSRLEGEKTKVALYEATLSGEKTKADIFGTYAQAYATNAEVVSKKYDVDFKKADLSLKIRQATLDEYKAALSEYEIETKALAERASVLVDGFKLESMAYSAEVESETSIDKIHIEEIQAAIEVARLNMQKAVAEVDSVTKSYIAVKELQLKGTEGIMNVGAQLTASALNAVNASASIGFSGSASTSESSNESQSISENHNWEES